ncbi:MAG TPA: hypothetical protein VK433_08235 [Stellaceae bacterium]|nr:hypothetical protein [Stellaceae bacterium]
MTKVVEAAKRLERAVIRLEAAMERVEDGAERQEAVAALAEAKSQYAALSRVTQLVAGRLDQAILRLDRTLLED